MRRLALVALALACAPTTAAADLTVAPRDFSPTTAGLNSSRELAVSRLRVDRTAPLITEINAYNRSRSTFQGDNKRFTTISPNNDGLRDSAKIRFMLSEPARVHFEVTRTLSRPETIYELKAKLGAGRNVFTWFPPKTIGPRTYLLRITVEDKVGNRRTYGADNAREGRRLRSAVVRVLGVDAGFTAESYPASSTARLAVETDATSLTVQTFRAGPEDTPTHSDTLMNGVAVNNPVTIPWSARHRRAMLNFAVGPWPTGVYYVRLTANDGRIGYAPFIVRPTTLGSTSRVAVVMPTNTWQAYNFRDSDGNGWGDTWYAKGAQSTAALGRAYIRRGVPPQWRKYDVGVLRWLHMTGKKPEIITETDLESIRTAEELLGLYDLVVFSGHTEYVTRHEFNLIEGYRNVGGNLAFLSANNFFWEVHREGKILRRTRLWREMGRPESAIIGVQYRANDDGRIQRPFVVRSTTTAPWLWAGTGLTDGAAFGQELGGYGIEIDQTTVFTPPQTIVLADVLDLYGPGLTGQMTYYESGAAKVFAAGTLDFGGTATYWPVRRILENLWARLTAP